MRQIESTGRKFYGWKAIGRELGVCEKTAYRYSRHPDPARRLLVSYVAGRVFAWESWLDAYEASGESAAERDQRRTA